MAKAAARRVSGSPRTVVVSGGFDPLHIGHVRMFKKACSLGDRLVVVVNNDHWLRKKKGFAFMPQLERVELIRSLPFVDDVLLTDHAKDDADMSVSRMLREVKPDIFANGGDRKKMSDIPEAAVCRELGIRMVFNIGEGGKIQSSSWMIQNASRPIKRSERPWGEYYGWDQGRGWNLKTIYIKPGKRLSLQYHRRREECWLLVSGDATATVHDAQGLARTIVLKKGATYCVGTGQTHRLESKRGGIVVEVAYGDFDENDIVRIEDDHGRAANSRAVRRVLK
jgi:cytidyltransferase-like protein